MWLLILAGCLTGSYYPSHESWQLGADSGNPPAESEDIPCNREDEGTLATLTVNNPTEQSYALYRLDDSCVERLEAVLGAGESWQDQVGNHVVWVVREPETERLIRWFSLPSGASVDWVESLP